MSDHRDHCRMRPEVPNLAEGWRALPAAELEELAAWFDAIAERGQRNGYRCEQAKAEGLARLVRDELATRGSVTRMTGVLTDECNAGRRQA